MEQMSESLELALLVQRAAPEGIVISLTYPPTEMERDAVEAMRNGMLDLDKVTPKAADVLFGPTVKRPLAMGRPLALSSGVN